MGAFKLLHKRLSSPDLKIRNKDKKPHEESKFGTV